MNANALALTLCLISFVAYIAAVVLEFRARMRRKADAAETNLFAPRQGEHPAFEVRFRCRNCGVSFVRHFARRVNVTIDPWAGNATQWVAGGRGGMVFRPIRCHRCEASSAKIIDRRPL